MTQTAAVRLALLVALGLAAGACAGREAGPSATASQGQAARSCFRAGDVNGWRPVDERTVHLRAGVNRVYRLQLMSPCSDINWSETIGIEARGSQWICSGLDAVIIAPSPIGPRRCPVTNVQALTPAETAALPPAQRP